ncbi:MAG: hypothetical protein M1840_001058 [Geoglossum simile]|nr:MAG: hypothetical protein M1840_001058 [Geoglossum simile]
MAPTRGKRPSIRNKVVAKPKPTTTPPTAPSKTKRSKRTTKHLTFVNKISKNTTGKSPTSVTKRRGRRGRPSKPLLADLQSLADALPDTSEIPSGEGAVLLRKKSLKSRPGALKRKAKVEKGERERFNRNLAQMVGVVGEGGVAAAATSTRWAALRGFVSQTLERKEGFCS